MTTAETAGHEELPLWLGLRRAGLGTTSFSHLLSFFGDITTAWSASAPALRESGLNATYARAFEKARANHDPDRELAALGQHGIRALTWLDEGFPQLLRDIPQSPPVLFLKGRGALPGRDAVAIVGTRNVTAYGRQATELFAATLARAGMCVVSGLARGVDTIAHRVAVEEGSSTIAVLAGGLDGIFPRENSGLAERICETGLLVSEYPPGVAARADHFPRRNRILSGLARAVLVVEAGKGSGALHTANWAFEQSRDVFAIPGSIFSTRSDATNQLIRENTARLVATPEQLLEELNLAAAGPAPVSERRTSARTAAPARVRPRSDPGPGLTLNDGDATAAAILAWLEQAGPAHIDDLARGLNLNAAVVASTLQILELEGQVREDVPLTYGRS